MNLRYALALSAVAMAGAGGCAPNIGDGCQNSSDCSVTGERVCDVAQPGGYCTVQGCDPDACPDGALCVEWRFRPTRTAATWCMKSCGGDGDCRSEYACVLPDGDGNHVVAPPQSSQNGSSDGEDTQTTIARVIDLDPGRRERGFCATASQTQ